MAGSVPVSGGISGDSCGLDPWSWVTVQSVPSWLRLLSFLYAFPQKGSDGASQKTSKQQMFKTRHVVHSFGGPHYICGEP